MKQRTLFTAARAYHGAGLSFLPIGAQGDKSPCTSLLSAGGLPRGEWKPLQQRQPTQDEIRAWYDHGRIECGLAIIGGKVSGNLEILDIDTWDLVEPFMTMLATDSPGLIDCLVQVKTPRPGLHLYYRCATIGGSTKLARKAETDPVTGKQRPKTTIEVKGEGGYCLAPPSPGSCHPTGRQYEYVTSRHLLDVQTITPEQRTSLFEVAKSFDSYQKPASLPLPQRSILGAAQQDRPGDDFNRRGDWRNILQPHGWRFQHESNEGISYWSRPGKASGVSATTNYGGSDLFYVFSTNADPFDSGTAYSKFSAYAILFHNGNYADAARALRLQGFGHDQTHGFFFRRDSSLYRSIGRAVGFEG